MDVRSEPCAACPYRRDVPSGLWAPEEYAKLPPYDAETFAQPPGAFMCHATPEHACAGWAAVGTSRGHAYDLLALRLAGVASVPAVRTPLFASGAEAAEHGLRDVACPSEEARDRIARLIRKHARLRDALP